MKIDLIIKVEDGMYYEIDIDVLDEAKEYFESIKPDFTENLE